VAERRTFKQDLIEVLERHHQDHGSDTPAEVLADFICGCLCAFDDGINKRDIASTEPPQLTLPSIS